MPVVKKKNKLEQAKKLAKAELDKRMKSFTKKPMTSSYNDALKSVDKAYKKAIELERTKARLEDSRRALLKLEQDEIKKRLTAMQQRIKTAQAEEKKRDEERKMLEQVKRKASADEDAKKLLDNLNKSFASYEDSLFMDPKKANELMMKRQAEKKKLTIREEGEAKLKELEELRKILKMTPAEANKYMMQKQAKNKGYNLIDDILYNEAELFADRRIDLIKDKLYTDAAHEVQRHKTIYGRNSAEKLENDLKGRISDFLKMTRLYLIEEFIRKKTGEKFINISGTSRASMMNIPGKPPMNISGPLGGKPPGAGVMPVGAKPAGAGVMPVGAKPAGAGVMPVGAKPAGAGYLGGVMPTIWGTGKGITYKTNKSKEGSTDLYKIVTKSFSPKNPKPESGIGKFFNFKPTKSTTFSSSSSKNYWWELE